MYTLARFGFPIKDGISPPTKTSTRSQSSPQPTLANSSGLRLSHITPTQSQEIIQAQSPFSFTSMLNSDVPLTQLQPPYVQHQPSLQDLPQQSTQQAVSVTTQTFNLTPHQIYRGQQGNRYQPRVSSPLRNAVPVNDGSELPTSPIQNSQPTLPISFVTAASLPNYRSISAPDPSSDPWQQPRGMDPSSQDSSDYQQSPPGSQETQASIESVSQDSDATDDSFSMQSIQDFRKLMPRTRSLPFIKRSKTKAAKPKSGQKPAQKAISRSMTDPANELHMTKRNRGTCIDDSDASVAEKLPATPERDGFSVDSQIDLHPAPPQPSLPQTNAPMASPCSFEVSGEPIIMITDPTILDKVNQATSNLLDQYTADLERGCDGTACAQFYWEQIHMVRRNFWLKQLTQYNQGGL